MNRRHTRALVVAVLLICGFLVCGFPESLHGTGIVLVVGLVVIDVALIRATGGLAFARRRSLDERQTALRDLAHRRGFRLLGPAFLVGLLLWFPGSALAAWHTLSFPQVDRGISGRLILGVLELVAMMPTLVIAWMEPVAPGTGRRGTFATPAVAASGALVAWLLIVAAAPVQRAAPNAVLVGLTASGATCRHFIAGRTVGAAFGATVGTHVEVCWNGSQAFVVGDGSPAPGGLAQLRGDPDLTACGADSWGDFAFVTGPTCTARTSADGTLHYTFRAGVSPLPFRWGARQVAMTLVVTRSGRVLTPL